MPQPSPKWARLTLDRDGRTGALRETVGVDEATPWWREAHRLRPSNRTYKRQAWTLESTVPGQPSDLLQEPTDRYAGNWLNDLVAQGGLQNYTPAFSGPSRR